MLSIDMTAELDHISLLPNAIRDLQNRINEETRGFNFNGGLTVRFNVTAS